jgi:hypothetical protein
MKIWHRLATFLSQRGVEDTMAYSPERLILVTFFPKRKTLIKWAYSECATPQISA